MAKRPPRKPKQISVLVTPELLRLQDGDTYLGEEDGVRISDLLTVTCVDQALAIALASEVVLLLDGDEYPMDDGVRVQDVVMATCVDAWGDEGVSIADEMHLALV